MGSFNSQSYILFYLDLESKEEENIKPNTYKEAHHSVILFSSFYVHVDRVWSGLFCQVLLKKAERPLPVLIKLKHVTSFIELIIE